LTFPIEKCKDEDMNSTQATLIAHAAIAKLNAHYGINCPMPAITWNLRGQSCLGRAYGSFRIDLNAKYAAALGDAYSETIQHEAAHIVTSYRCARLQPGDMARTGGAAAWAPHGRQWQQAMRLLGLIPNARANVSADVLAQVPPARRVTKVKVSCGCAKVYEVTPARATKLVATSRCARCSGRFFRVV
jgi:predicted SprT family Zn-dependent metalloprotease